MTKKLKFGYSLINISFICFFSKSLASEWGPNGFPDLLPSSTIASANWGLQQESFTTGVHFTSVFFRLKEPELLVREAKISYGLEMLSFDPETEIPFSAYAHVAEAGFAFRIFSFFTPEVFYRIRLESQESRFAVKHLARFRQGFGGKHWRLGLEIESDPFIGNRLIFHPGVFIESRLGPFLHLGLGIFYLPPLNAGDLKWSDLALRTHGTLKFNNGPDLSIKIQARSTVAGIQAEIELPIGKSDLGIRLGASINTEGTSGFLIAFHHSIRLPPPHASPFWSGSIPIELLPKGVLIAPAYNSTRLGNLDFIAEVIPEMLYDAFETIKGYRPITDLKVRNLLYFHRFHKIESPDETLRDILKNYFQVGLLILPSLREEENKGLVLELVCRRLHTDEIKTFQTWVSSPSRRDLQKASLQLSLEMEKYLRY